MRLALISLILALACSLAANAVLYLDAEQAHAYVHEAGYAILKTRMFLDRETARIIDECRRPERSL